MKKLQIAATVIIVICFVVFMTGCATNQLRITEYSGTTIPIPGMNAAAGGCQVSQEGVVTGRLVYIGEKCQYDSQPESVVPVL